MSDAEEALLTQIKWARLPAPEREVALIAGRRFRFDLVWPAQKLALEVEGGVYVQGRHTQGKGFESGCEKANLATIMGYRVLRVTPKMIDDGRALGWVQKALESERH